MEPFFNTFSVSTSAACWPFPPSSGMKGLEQAHLTLYFSFTGRLGGELHKTVQSHCGDHQLHATHLPPPPGGAVEKCTLAPSRTNIDHPSRMNLPYLSIQNPIFSVSTSIVYACTSPPVDVYVSLLTPPFCCIVLWNGKMQADRIRYTSVFSCIFPLLSLFSPPI